MQSGLEGRLKKALAGRSPAQLNEFQFLNLEMVKAETGDRWIDVRKKVYGVAAHFVEKRMHADDVVVRCRGGFILIFAHLTAEESRARLDMISQELNLFFLGDQILKHLEITAKPSRVNAAEFAQFIQMSAGAVPTEGVEGGRRRADAGDAKAGQDAKWQQDAARGRESAAGGHEASRPVPAGVARWVEGEPVSKGADRGLQQGERSVAEKSVHWQDGPPAKAGEAGYPHSEVPRRGPAGEAGWQNQPGRGAKPETGTPASAETPRAPASTSPNWRTAVEAATDPDVHGLPEAVFVESKPHWDDIVFKPCWDARLNAITSNICLARRIKDGSVHYGRDTLMGSGALDLHRALDRAVAIAAQRAYQQVYAQGESCNICIPVHYDTIRAVSDRVSYFSILQVVPQHLRKHFFLRVDHIPPGAPISQMQELFRSMKCFGSNLLATIPFSQADLSRFEGCGIDIFGSEFPVGRHAWDAGDPQIAALGRRAKAAEAMAAATFLTQVNDFDGLVAGVGAGVRVFAGEAVGPETALPMPRRDVPFSELFERAEEMQAIEGDLQRSAALGGGR